RAHRTDDRQIFHLRRQLREVFADANPRDGGVDLLDRAAIGVARFQIERVILRGPAAHPEQDTGALALGIRRGIGSQRPQPTRAGAADNSGETEPVTARKMNLHGFSPTKPSEVSPRTNKLVWHALSLRRACAG